MFSQMLYMQMLSFSYSFSATLLKTLYGLDLSVPNAPHTNVK